MIVHHLVNGNEENEVYKSLAIDNLARQYDFLRSIVTASLSLGRPFISSSVILALNAHAISCLHVNAGQYRICSVDVGDYKPPPHFLVPELMNAFIDEVNWSWERSDAALLAAYVLWKINSIHPFINGNGRTARALCYFVMCTKLGGFIEGDTILPELIKRDRVEYVQHLKFADAKAGENDPNFLAPLHQFIVKRLEEQISSAQSSEVGPTVQK